MKKNYLKKLIILIFIIFLIGLNCSTIVFADVGDFESYGSRGSGSGSSWSGSSSSDSDSGLVYFLLGLAVRSPLGFVIALIIIGIIIYIKKKGIDGTFIDKFSSLDSNERSVEASIKEIDPLFNREEFVATARTVFIKLQNAWANRKWEEVRPFETNELFEQHREQLKGFIDRKQINKIERVAVLSCKLDRFGIPGDYEQLTVILKSRMNDYIIDETTGNVIKGKKDLDIYSTYRLTFIRKSGIKTKEGTSSITTTNCPNCGAPTKITMAGSCEYCSSVITTGEYDWVLSNLERIS